MGTACRLGVGWFGTITRAASTGLHVLACYSLLVQAPCSTGWSEFTRFFTIGGADSLDLPPLTGVTPPSTEVKVPESKAGEKGKEEDSSLVPVTEGIQPVVKKIVKKVDNNEFVDFTDLLQDQFSYKQDLSLPANQTGLVLVQSLESLRRKRKKITDF